MATVTCTAGNFNSLVDREGITLIDWWAPWCGPCRAFAPIFEEASERHKGITFAKINTDEEHGPVKPFRVSAATYALSSAAENTVSSLGRSGAPAPGPKKPPRARTPAVKAGLPTSWGDPARNRVLTVARMSVSTCLSLI